jgi:RNA polymerase sigma-70 factor (ECF subfamily)
MNAEKLYKLCSYEETKIVKSKKRILYLGFKNYTSFYPMIAFDQITDLQMKIARNEDHVAYKELFTSFYSCLFHFAFSFVKAKQPAEEIVSDVFIKIWEKRKGLDKIKNLKIYLYIATKNTSLNYLERQKKIITDDIDKFSNQFKSVYFNPEQLMITADMVALIYNAIESLPSRCKTIFKLVKEDDLKYKEVASILNISERTVENQLAIALRKIAKTISFDVRKTIPSSVMGY